MYYIGTYLSPYNVKSYDPFCNFVANSSQIATILALCCPGLFSSLGLQARRSMLIVFVEFPTYSQIQRKHCFINKFGPFKSNSNVNIY
jgi:hypothetical protein